MTKINWISILESKPQSKFNWDIDVLVRITGLSMTAAEYEEYKVLKWRQKIGCFIEWEYDSQGNLNSVLYNDPKAKPSLHPTVTHWTYFNKVEE